MLTTLEKVREFKSVVGSAQAVLEGCLSAADAWLKGQIGQELEAPVDAQGAPVDSTVILSGNGGLMLRLPQRPVRAVSSVSVDGATYSVLAPDATADGQQPIMYTTSGNLMGRGGFVFPWGVGNVFVRYQYGYLADHIPYDLQQAEIILAHLLFEERNRVGVSNKTLGPEQVNEVARKLDDYDVVSQVIQKYGRHW
jgi:hypothetical protein